MKTYLIYCHTFPNGKMYFGQTCHTNPNKRWGRGLGYKGCPLMWNAIQKYGWDNIDHRVISIGLDKDEADFQEMFYISAYRTNEPEFGYNITLGGQGASGTIMSEELKRKHRCRMKEDNPAFHMTDEWRKHISESQKGKVMSEHMKKLTSERMKKNNPMKNPEIAARVTDKIKGRKLTEEHKSKISRKIEVYDIVNDKCTVYCSIVAAATDLGCSACTIGDVLAGRSKTFCCKKYTAKYI